MKQGFHEEGGPPLPLTLVKGLFKYNHICLLKRFWFKVYCVAPHFKQYLASIGISAPHFTQNLLFI